MKDATLYPDYALGRKLSVFFSYGAIYIGIFYILVVIYGLITCNPITGNIRNSIRIIMEITTILSSIMLVLLTVSIHLITPKNNQILSISSILFMAASFIVTSIVHFTCLMVGPKLIAINESFRNLISLEWPSVFLALDILAWDVLFGLSFLCIGLTFLGKKSRWTAGILMIIAAILSLTGVIAVPMNNMNIRFIGILGYTLLPILACIYLIKALRKESRNSNEIPF